MSIKIKINCFNSLHPPLSIYQINFGQILNKVVDIAFLMLWIISKRVWFKVSNSKQHYVVKFYASKSTPRHCNVVMLVARFDLKIISYVRVHKQTLTTSTRRRWRDSNGAQSHKICIRFLLRICITRCLRQMYSFKNCN